MNGGGSSSGEEMGGSSSFGAPIDGFSGVPGAPGAPNEHNLLPLTLPTSPTLLPLTSSPMSSALEMAAKHQASNSQPAAYFSEENSSHEDYRRLTENTSASLELAAMPMGLMAAGAANLSKRTAGKKRKGAANASIDLQTKIRLIELAEEYQYDPKIAGKAKQDGDRGAAANAAASKEQMSGIRLAAQFGLNKSTVSRILKRKEEFKKAYYKDNISGCSKHINKKSKFEKLNRLVENWFDMNRDKKIAVTDTHIRDVGKRFAEELGIGDFRGSNGWVRSLRNRKEHQSRNLSIEALELEKLKRDAEAIDRMRAVFPNGMKDLSGFFRDLAIYLEKGVGDELTYSESAGPAIYGSSAGSDRDGSVAAVAEAALNGGVLPASAYGTFDSESSTSRDEDRAADEFLKKKMIDSMRAWSHELMESELSRMKKRLKPRTPQHGQHSQLHEHQELHSAHHSQQAATL